MAMGAILVSQGLVSDEQLAQATREQQRSGERLEQTLARLGIAERGFLAAFGLEHYSLLCALGLEDSGLP